MSSFQNKLILVVCAVLVVIGLWRVTADDFSIVDVTGEEALDGQVRGLAQLTLNIANPTLRTEPYADIANTDVNPFGVNTFLHHEVEESKREEQLRLISEAGFHWIRQEFPWEDIEIHGRGDFIDRRNNPDGIDAWQKYDHIVDLTEEYDIEIIARLSNPPAWSRAAGDDKGTYAPPDDFDDYAHFAAAVAERYRGRITYYQLWNEPNIYPEWGENPVDPEAYADLLCRAYDTIKAVDPDAVVLSGALAPTAELSGQALNDYIFLERMYAAGAGDCFDILSMQGYGLWSGPTDHRMRGLVVNYGRNQYIRDMMVRHGDTDKAIWISEMNWNVAPEDVQPLYGRVTLDQQARWAPLAYQRAQEDWPWIGVINMWYFKRASDDWLTERRPEAYFQMLEPDFTPLPVYDSMAEYATQPPVMYSGRHGADHWAVSKDQSGALSFDFAGTSLNVLVDSEIVSGAQVRMRVDGGVWQTYDCCARSILWRGRSGQHHVEIASEGEVAITGFEVRDEPPITWLALAMGVILLGGAWYIADRQRRQEETA